MYKKMIEDAKAMGLTSEKMMWESTDEVEDMLCALKKEHPDKYWKFIRKTHGILFKGHYTEEFAMHDVMHMEPIGMYWSVSVVEEATKNIQFPAGVNKWDKFVAVHIFKNDLAEVVSDDEIIKYAVEFFFKDKDWKSADGGCDKVWRYMCSAYSMK
jgi:hypothetical protein